MAKGSALPVFHQTRLKQLSNAKLIRAEAHNSAAARQHGSRAAGQQGSRADWNNHCPKHAGRKQRTFFFGEPEGLGTQSNQSD